MSSNTARYGGSTSSASSRRAAETRGWYGGWSVKKWTWATLTAAAFTGLLAGCSGKHVQPPAPVHLTRVDVHDEVAVPSPMVLQNPAPFWREPHSCGAPGMGDS